MPSDGSSYDHDTMHPVGNGGSDVRTGGMPRAARLRHWQAASPSRSSSGAAGCGPCAPAHRPARARTRTHAQATCARCARQAPCGNQARTARDLRRWSEGERSLGSMAAGQPGEGCDCYHLPRWSGLARSSRVGGWPCVEQGRRQERFDVSRGRQQPRRVLSHGRPQSRVSQSLWVSRRPQAGSLKPEPSGVVGWQWLDGLLPVRLLASAPLGECSVTQPSPPLRKTLNPGRITKAASRSPSTSRNATSAAQLRNAVGRYRHSHRAGESGNALDHLDESE